MHFPEEAPLIKFFCHSWGKSLESLEVERYYSHRGKISKTAVNGEVSSFIRKQIFLYCI